MALLLVLPVPGSLHNLSGSEHEYVSFPTARVPKLLSHAVQEVFC